MWMLLSLDLNININQPYLSSKEHRRFILHQIKYIKILMEATQSLRKSAVSTLETPIDIQQSKNTALSRITLKQEITKKRRELLQNIQQKTHQLHEQFPTLKPRTRQKLKTSCDIKQQAQNQNQQPTTRNQFLSETRPQKVSRNKEFRFSQKKLIVDQQFIHSMQRDIYVKDLEIAKLKKNIKIIRSQSYSNIEQLKRQNNVLKRLVKQYENDQQKYLATISDVERDLKLYKSELQSKQKIIDDLKNTQSKSSDNTMPKVIQIQRQIQNPQTKIEELKNELEKLKILNQTLQKQRDDFEEVIFEQQCQNTLYRKYLNSERDCHDQFEKQKIALNLKLAILKKDYHNSNN